MLPPSGNAGTPPTATTGPETAEARPVLKFVLEGKPQIVPLQDDEVTVGRSKTMSIVIPVSGISRHHATFRRDGSRWVVDDAGSANGTYVGTERIGSAELHDGDSIHLGPVPILFSHPQSARGAARLPTAPPPGTAGSPSPRVAFSEAEVAQVSMSINLANLQLSVGPAMLPQATMPVSGAAVHNRTTVVEPSEPTTSRRFGPEQLWAIGLFSEVGRALQAATDLDEMLETLLNLIFTQVPADFALIGSIDEVTNEVVPKVVRQAGHATAEGTPVSRTVIRSALAARTAYVVNDVVKDAVLNEAVSLKRNDVYSVMCVPLHHEGRIHGVIYLDTRNRQTAFEERHLEIVTAMALFSAVAIEQFALRAKTLEQQRQRERLVRYIDAAVAERVIAAGDQVPMIADKEEVTVLFSDLKGFTSLSEQLSPNEVVDVLNGIFGRLTEAVFHHQGTLDKFIGDGMMAFFGAPLKSSDHARQAVRAALEMLTALDEFNRNRPDAPPIGIRIGINTGPVIVGDIGSPTRKDYTVIGDTVNVASRLESSVAQTNQIVVGPATRAALGDEFEFEALPAQNLKGKKMAIEPFRVVKSASG